MVAMVVLVVILMFLAAGVLLLVSVHESLYLLNAHLKHVRAENKRGSGVKRATQEITTVLRLGDD